MLDLNPTAIPPEQFEEWRKNARRSIRDILKTRACQDTGYLSRSQMGRRIGVTPAMWVRWEREGLSSGPMSALVREHMA